METPNALPLPSRSQIIQLLPVSKLRLDAENPRLASLRESVTQLEILKVLWKEMAVDEIVLSIAANGFFPEEPLFAIPNETEPDTFIVLEGNRRLAAVLILLDDDLRKKVGATNMPYISPKEKKDISFLPVSVYDSRETLWSYLSFRHINSPMEWDAFSKAKYVTFVHDEYGVSLEEIARRTGDRHRTVKRLYRGYKVLQQAEKQTDFKTEDRVRNKFYFSHLYTAIDYPEFQEYLGISDAIMDDNPVRQDKLDELANVMKWLYGRKSLGIEPIVQKQNPDLQRLKDVLGSPVAIDALTQGFSLERSFDISIGDPKRFRQAVIAAKDALQQAKGTITTGFPGQGDENIFLFEIVQEILDITQTIIKEMKPKLSKSKRKV